MRAKDYRNLKSSITKAKDVRVKSLTKVFEEGRNSKKELKYFSSEVEKVMTEYRRSIKSLEKVYKKR